MEWNTKDWGEWKPDPGLRDIFSSLKGWGRKKPKVVNPKPKKTPTPTPKPKSKRNNPEMYPPTKKKKTNKVLKGMGLKPEGHWKKMFDRKKNKGKNGN